MKIVLLNVEQAQSIYRSQMVRDFPESELKPFASVQGMMTRGLYEPIHGSAPDIAGQDKANPSAILMAFAMMLNDLGETDKAAKLNAAILAQVEEGKVVTADIGGTAGTKEFTQAVIARL